MATQKDLDFTYTLIDKLFRESVGEMADFSGAKYDGDTSLTLEAAQRKKHELIYRYLKVKHGGRILDLGCGWGAMLDFFRRRGITGVGVTLAQGQVDACRHHGFDVHLHDAREVTCDTFGPFDGVVSLGAFEHFCSVDQWRAGMQDAIYSKLFEHVAGMLPKGGRFFLQTMVFGRKMIPYDEIDVRAPRLSDAHVLGLLRKTFPGSWLPRGCEQVERNAAACFRLIYKESGRLDYIPTIAEWQRRFGEFTPRKALTKLALVPRYVLSADFRYAFASGISANAIAFERELFDHYRFVFERR
ncbi:MAG TPA: class I SAM-dependent methyltransferase [Gemmatimonadales bacterium]|jgi:cyclopropane-fatty-acyl-phospholipid synthase